MMNELLNVIYSNNTNNWEQANREVFDALFGVGGRYPARAQNVVKLRAPKFSQGSGVPFAAYIHPSNPDSGAYGGTSFVIFPVDDAPCLIALVVGTQGIAPDEDILSRPGHGRKVKAIVNWLNYEFGQGKQIAWSKADPVRIDLDVPKQVRERFAAYQAIFERYGKVIYGLYVPDEDRNATRQAATAFLDLLLEERNWSPLTAHQANANIIRASYLAFILPSIQRQQVMSLLNDRRYVILEGPPGTGKTRLAMQLLTDEYAQNGTSIQFHPNVTYENFIGGLAPVTSDNDLGLRFAPKRGFLMDAVLAAVRDPQRPYLLHIDEINRADLSKILGEAIFLFEPKSDQERVVKLAYNFGDPLHDYFKLPLNLHIIGTMNSSDRSIAIMDVAIRRRFAFVKLWPQASIVEAQAAPLMHMAFRELLSIFIEHASDEALRLLPGHAYFLEKDVQKAAQSLQTNVAPLLEEYLEQGYVVGFAEQLRAYLQWIESL